MLAKTFLPMLVLLSCTLYAADPIEMNLKSNEARPAIDPVNYLVTVVCGEVAWNGISKITVSGRVLEATSTITIDSTQGNVNGTHTAQGSMNFDGTTRGLRFLRNLATFKIFTGFDGRLYGTISVLGITSDPILCFKQ